VTALPPPPIPREHGAWAMLYAPLVLGLAIFGAPHALDGTLLVLAATAAYMGQNAARLLEKRRRPPGLMAWIAIFSALTLGAAGALVLWLGHWDLVTVGALGTAVFAAFWLAKTQARRRSLPMELAVVAALGLTGPAAVAVGQGGLVRDAWLLWLATTAFFWSSVFYVRMIFVVGRAAKQGADVQGLRRAARFSLRYHLGLAGAVLAASVLVAALAVGPEGGRAGLGAGLLLAAAYAPAVVRGVRAAWRPTGELPSLVRVGVLEAVSTTWFVVLLVTAAHLAGAAA